MFWFYFILLWSQIYGIQKRPAGQGSKNSYRDDSNVYGFGLSGGIICDILWYTDHISVWRWRGAAGRSDLCRICKAGIFPAPCGVYFKSGGGSYNGAFLSEEQGGRCRSDGDLCMYDHYDSIERVENDPVYPGIPAHIFACCGTCGTGSDHASDGRDDLLYLEPQVPLFQYGMAVVCVSYVLFAFAHVDAGIAAYDLAQIENGNTAGDYSYLSCLSTVAAPVIAEYLKEHPDKSYYGDGIYNWKWEYMQENDRMNQPVTLRTFNLSYLRAKRIFSEK